MQLLFFCPRWGSEAMPWADFLPRVRAAGYDGVELGIANDTPAAELAGIWEQLDRHGLQVIAQHYATEETDFARHHDAYAAWLEKIRPFPVLRINSQTGKDHFSMVQNQALLATAHAFGAAAGTTVLHETHRGKFSFAAHVTHQYLLADPALRLTLDVSHWVNVAESYLADQPAALALALARTEHLHARVGFPEGPQVPDPRAPEWQPALRAHLAWWDAVVARKRAAGPAALLTIAPEFGPPPYLPTLPFTRQPVTSQWEVNVYMMNLLKERYLTG